MTDDQIGVELQEETVKLLREIAETEDNTVNEQILKMMLLYTTSGLISKTKHLQNSLTEDTQDT